MDNKIKLITKNNEIIGLEFNGITFEKRNEETKLEFINRAKKEIEKERNINFKQYFTPENVVKEELKVQKEQPNKKINLITTNNEIIGLEFDGLRFKRTNEETKLEFINRAKREIEKERNINFKQYFTPENIVKKELNPMNDKKEKEKKVQEKKTASNSWKKRIIAATLTGLLVLGVACAAKDYLDNQTQIVENIDIENKSLDELLAMLEEGQQKETFNTIVDTQDYFNDIASETVKRPEDKDAQLFLHFDEVQATYMYLNAKSMDSDTLAKVFGKGKIMLMNKDTGVYETITQEGLSGKYLTAMQNLNYYYTRATETSGISNLFENKKEKEFFDNFEKLVLDYNKTKGSKEKAAIKEKLDEIYLSGEVDALFNKYPGATSVIATSMVPYLYMEDVISEEKYNSIVEINENVTCEDIYNQIGVVVSKQEENGKEEVINEIVKKQDELLKNKNRSINMQESLEGYTYSDLEKTTQNTTPSFKENKKVQKVVEETKSRKEAVEKTSEKEVQKAEKEADKKIEEKNEAQDTYWDEHQKGYNSGYDKTFAALQNNSALPKMPSNQSKGYIDGWNKGVSSAKEDWAQIQKDQAEYNKKNPEVTEEKIDSKYGKEEVEQESKEETKKEEAKQEVKPEEETENKEMNNSSDTWTEFIDSTYYPEPENTETTKEETKKVLTIESAGKLYTSEITVSPEEKTLVKGIIK